LRPFTQRIVRLVRALIGKDFFARRDLHCRTERFGSDYGGWEVAVDGLDHRSIVYSFGIGEDVTFDLALIERFGLTVHAFDPTPRSLRWIREQGPPPSLVVHDYGIAAQDGAYSFFPPANPDHVSHSILGGPSAGGDAIKVPMKRLDTIMQELGHNHVDLLKLDIEGAEYEVIEALELSITRPGQILVEFHHRFPGAGIAKTKAALSALRRTGYRLFAVSRSGEEYGLVLRAPAGGEQPAGTRWSQKPKR
jgi:FkbM family methyltransferase